jgi:hypothetical protein
MAEGYNRELLKSESEIIGALERAAGETLQFGLRPPQTDYADARPAA